jgi:hypothetical protein
MFLDKVSLTLPLLLLQRSLIIFEIERNGDELAEEGKSKSIKLAVESKFLGDC